MIKNQTMDLLHGFLFLTPHFANLCAISKTTLLNLIMGRLQPLRGSVSINSGLRIGHFTQHSSDNFDLKLSAVENLLNMYEEAEDQEMRTFLGKFQIQNDDALKPMMLLSGGQKSRVAFAALAYKKPHVLVVDEGSNHLSMEAVDALVRVATAVELWKRMDLGLPLKVPFNDPHTPLLTFSFTPFLPLPGRSHSRLQGWSDDRQSRPIFCLENMLRALGCTRRNSNKIPRRL